ncbi:MAG: hypothetical protein QM820_17140 [Minicystis sp.]
MRAVPFTLAGALLFQPALAAAQTPPPLVPAVQPAPPPPYVPTMRYKTHSTPLIVGGGVLTGLGALSLLGGVTAIVADQSNHGEFQGILSIVVGIPLLVNGVGCVAGGIPMIVIGNRKIPAGYAGARPSPLPAISPGPRTTLSWTF